jgi:hypothetical protein
MGFDPTINIIRLSVISASPSDVSMGRAANEGYLQGQAETDLRSKSTSLKWINRLKT